MGIFTVDKCFGCQTAIERESFAFYCDQCIAEQQAEHAAEREAFAAFHRYADSVARGES